LHFKKLPSCRSPALEGGAVSQFDAPARFPPGVAGQVCAVALRIALGMIWATRIYFIIFGILTIAGGTIGYVSKGSMPSIIAGTIAGILLLVAAFLLPAHSTFALIIALVVSLLLAAQFVPKFFATWKMMPAGMMSILSVLGVIAAVVSWLEK
jgi:uncharacterized membrane protein (UPF0136 family)